MSWGASDTTAGSQSVVSLGKESYISTVRDEYIPVGYNLTSEETIDGKKQTITKFIQTGTINVKCKVKTIVETVEERGLTQSAATGHSWFGDVKDERLTGTWYSNGRNGGNVAGTSPTAMVAVPNILGTVIKVSAKRANEANGWTVTKTTTTTSYA